MIIVLGFTLSDPDTGYSSFTDGHRPEARQQSITVVLEGAGTAYTAEQWAEAAFIASNHPSVAPTGPARALQLALAEQVSTLPRSLSVGDTVTAHGQTLTCTSTAWVTVDEDHAGPDGPSAPPRD